MKKLIIIALVAVTMTAHAQLFTKKDWNRIALTSSLMFISGSAEGTAETLKYHYKNFKRVFPDANDEWWSAALSHNNKYKNGDPTQGPKFWGSTNVFVFVTDGYHCMRMIRNISMIVGVTIHLGNAQKWYKYIIEGLIYYVSFNAGFTFMYDVVFK